MTKLGLMSFRDLHNCARIFRIIPFDSGEVVGK